MLNFKQDVLKEVSREASKSDDPMCTDLLRFEKAFESRLLVSEQHYLRETVSLTEQRDSIVENICQIALDRLGLDLVAYDTFENLDGPVHLQKLFALVNCFMMLSKVRRHTLIFRRFSFFKVCIQIVKSMSHEESEYNMQIINNFLSPKLN